MAVSTIPRIPKSLVLDDTTVTFDLTMKRVERDCPISSNGNINTGITNDYIPVAVRISNLSDTVISQETYTQSGTNYIGYHLTQSTSPFSPVSSGTAHVIMYYIGPQPHAENGMATSTIPKSPNAFVNGSFTKVHSSISNVERANYKKSGNICAAEVTFTTSAAISDNTAVLFQGLPNARQGATRFAAFNKLVVAEPLVLCITQEGKILNQWSHNGIPAGQYQADFVYITEDGFGQCRTIMAVSMIPQVVYNDAWGVGEVYNSRLTQATMRWYKINGRFLFVWCVFKTTISGNADVALATGFPIASNGTMPHLFGNPQEVYINRNGALCTTASFATDTWFTINGFYESGTGEALKPVLIL